MQICLPYIFALCLFVQKVYEVGLLRFDNPLCVEAFCLPKQRTKILTFTLLFYSFQNPVGHWVALTIDKANK